MFSSRQTLGKREGRENQPPVPHIKRNSNIITDPTYNLEKKETSKYVPIVPRFSNLLDSALPCRLRGSDPPTQIPNSKPQITASTQKHTAKAGRPLDLATSRAHTFHARIYKQKRRS